MPPRDGEAISLPWHVRGAGRGRAERGRAGQGTTAASLPCTVARCTSSRDRNALLAATQAYLHTMAQPNPFEIAGIC